MKKKLSYNDIVNLIISNGDVHKGKISIYKEFLDKDILVIKQAIKE